MNWTDSFPLEINNVAGATGWGSDGHWNHGCPYEYESDVCDFPTYTCDCYNYVLLNAPEA